MSVFDKCVLLVAEGLGLGRIKPAPGTWGSLWGLPLGYMLGELETSWWVRLFVAAIMFLVGIPICRKGAELRNESDPGSVVWDEIAAFPIVYAFVPLAGIRGLLNLAIGFGLFRLFDIWKPPPVRQCDRLHGGFGIMADDTIAAIYASGLLYLSTLAY